jgi:hypothetical protein
MAATFTKPVLSESFSGDLTGVAPASMAALKIPSTESTSNATSA